MARKKYLKPKILSVRPKRPRCTRCDKIIIAGNRPDGIPHGVGLVRKDGEKINLCTECIVKIGQMDDEEFDKEMEDLKK